ncbi:DEAD/DEAH box helicase family protein [Candidatus Saccharibacteria bacterium]|nr:DEAD/DEAH box helicase family protein [Candidatus Saccharibacteria bacterium]
MNEETTKFELISPQIRASGWGVNETLGSQVLMEYSFTDGRLIGAGQRGKRKKADYVLAYKNQKLAIVEAKAEGKEITEGLEQVKDYAKVLNIRYVYSTNGHGVYFFDMKTGTGDHIEKYHAPEELFDLTFSGMSPMQLKVATEAFQRVKYSPRYYQENAINLAVDKIAGGANRALLTLATGTGKTFIAFQIVWKLFQTRWNKRGDDRRPRILFLADRNALIEQAMGDFNPLESEIIRISGKEIRKAGKVPTNGNIFFSIYQAMTSDISGMLSGEVSEETETEEIAPTANPVYKQYPSDFFDLIIIDECHRGGATNDGNWRAVLDHFSGATHLGMTATPKRTDNIDTYEYFGEPLYTYSLKDGIEDGFLTPFKMKSITTSFDTYHLSDGDIAESGEVDPDKEYTLNDFNRAIYIPKREEDLTRIMLEQINPEQKTIIFCNDEKHALMIRDSVNKLKTNSNPDYCVRITASEGEVGDEFLRQFRDNEKIIPTLVTTSRKLSTGVDSRNVRFIVLMRRVGSMTEFKQIIGRGTRIFDNKDYFTIVDFYGNDKMFNDPEWDGEPLPPTQDCPVDNPNCGGVINEPIPSYEGDSESKEPKEKTVVKLGEREQEITYDVNTRFYFEGKPVTSKEFLEKLFGELPDLFVSEDDLREKWANPRTRKSLLQGLAMHGFDEDKLEALKELVDATDSDVYDVLRYIAYARDTITRRERISLMRDYYFEQLSEGEKEFVNFVLGTYEQAGENELSLENLRGLLELKYRTLSDATTKLGAAENIRQNYINLQKELYAF